MSSQFLEIPFWDASSLPRALIFNCFVDLSFPLFYYKKNFLGVRHKTKKGRNQNNESIRVIA